MSKIAPQQSPPGSQPGANSFRQKTAGVSGSLAGRGVSNAAAKPVPKPTLSHTARFTSPAATMAEEKSGKRKNTLGVSSAPVVLLITGVSLGLLILGVFMVYIGDEKFIVDVIVLGAICIVMGLASFILGMTLVLKPLYRKRKHEEEAEEAAAGEPSVEDRNSSFSMSARQSRPAPPSTSHEDPQTGTSSGPRGTAESAGEGQHDPTSTRGKLRTPSPPLGAQSGREADRTSEDSSTMFSSSADEAEAGRDNLKQKLEDDIRALL